jgi:hypothetical protein
MFGTVRCQLLLPPESLGENDGLADLNDIVMVF